MPRLKRDMRRLSLYVPATLEAQVAEVARRRTLEMAYEPIAADLWREAMQRGLAAMLVERQLALPHVPERRTAHAIAKAFKGAANDRRR